MRCPQCSNGGWSEWVDGDCSVTCGVGEQTQSRTCNNPEPANGGAECTLEDGTIGRTEERIVPCDQGPCPIDGGWSEWVDGDCSVTCGVGEQTQSRTCNNPEPANGGAECTLEDGTAGRTEERIVPWPCDQGPCPIDGGWSEWVDGDCSVTCGVGEQTQSRTCNNPEPTNGGAECTLEDGTTGRTEERIVPWPCDQGTCPIDGGWSEWVDGDCSVTCGVGEQTQSRTCNNPEPANGGAECTLEDGTTGRTEERIVPCDQGPCPIDGDWSEWVDGGCSVTCGVGEQTQSRTCNNPEPANGGAECTLEDGTTGRTEERIVPCDQGPCSIDGGWSKWVDGDCSVTCGVGEQTQSRTCNNPEPANGGAECTLEDGTAGRTEERIVPWPCDQGPCPIDGGWSEWVDGDCSVTCGVGEQTQSRTCNNPEPANGGAECVLEDGTTGRTEERTVPCDQGPCPIDGGWSDWVDGDCSVTCGVGEQTQSRTCNNPEPANGGAECTLENGTAGRTEERIVPWPCDQGPCPIDGGWSEWVDGGCSVTCGVGEQTQSRTCNNPEPANGGAECTLEDGTTGRTEERIVPCDQGPCSIAS
ncbi:coadhesin-like [Branchiostoma floridae]|uniref:Coadhesin-like n=1 Tax=Branchiostoma floridae TaxID=7739 RepID=A0A9J7KHE3_BRAFL|nr:coadhesin-like [Branchiostoma floridae]